MKYILGFFITVGLIILLIVLLVAGGGDSTKTKVPSTSKTLESYASTAATVRLTIDGPITAPENHRATRITVGKDSTTYEELQGYDGQVTKLETYPNTQTSYTSFLRSLEIAGFTKGDTSAALKNDRGYCPLGTRYIFELEDSGKQLERFWSTSCSGVKSFQGKTSLNVTLFKKQVPNIEKVRTPNGLSFNL
ncbi:hypothetical protein H7Y63_02450 [Polaromonas sp.]|nr:hypothetical protein [Candidatus Saccharibacteria bacterium]